jgi:hypothetical protein
MAYTQRSLVWNSTSTNVELFCYLSSIGEKLNNVGRARQQSRRGGHHGGLAMSPVAVPCIPARQRAGVAIQLGKHSAGVCADKGLPPCWLVVNLKTAKTLGLATPESFLQHADEVTE